MRNHTTTAYDNSNPGGTSSGELDNSSKKNLDLNGMTRISLSFQSTRELVKRKELWGA